MRPMNDDDDMVTVTRTGGEVPVRSESQTDAGAVADGGDEAGLEEPSMVGTEEAGYGYGV
jgi:hypothetical protein